MRTRDNYRKIGIFLGVAFLLYWLVQDWAVATSLISSAVGGVGSAVGKLAEFTRQLVR